MDLQDLESGFFVRHRDFDGAVESAGAEKRRVEKIDPVRRGHDLDVAARVEAVHFRKKLDHRSVDFGRAARAVECPHAADRVDLIDEEDGRCFCPCHGENVFDETGAFTDEFLDEVGSGHSDESGIGF